MGFEAFLPEVQKREPRRWGVRTAHDYLSGIQTCAGDPVCAAKFFGMADGQAWQKALEDSKRNLVYSDVDMVTDRSEERRVGKECRL